MGMSTHVIGYTSENNEKYQKYLKILRSCQEADVDLPEEVDEYFEDTDHPEEVLSKDLPLTEYSDECSAGYEILVKDIPEGVEKIRFYNSY